MILLGKTAKRGETLAADSINTDQTMKSAPEESLSIKTLKQWQDSHVINVTMNQDVDINNGTDLDGFTTQITKVLGTLLRKLREG